MGEAGAVQDLQERAGVMVVVEEEEMEWSSFLGAAKRTRLHGRWRGVVGRPWI